MTEIKKYNNFRATMAIAKASLRSILRSPSAVIFTLAFPLIFIVVFANLGGGLKVDVGQSKTTDTTNVIYKALKQSQIIRFVTNQSEAEMTRNLGEGTLDAVIDIKKQSAPTMPVDMTVRYSKASAQKSAILKSLLSNILYNAQSRQIAMYQQLSGIKIPKAVDLKEEVISGREFKYIDFILPGQLGFSLLSTGVFGTAFVFLSLRQTLVIKRFFATPVKRYSIILGEMLARIVFSLFGAVVIVTIGHYVFHFTLINGISTLLTMLVLSFIGLIVFMGFGFVVSSIAKNESTIPPLSNIITLPQFLLSGTFFSTSVFPKWLQPLANILPLTHLNNAMRRVAFEGASLAGCTHELLILFIWGICVYAVAIKLFKWE